MNNFERTFNILEETNLNWTVSKKPLITEVEGLTTNSFGLFREDTKKWLGTVGKQYAPYQNSSLVETIVKASHNINTDISGGSLSGGKKVYLQLQLEDEQIENDTVKRYITALNSHDGTTSIAFGSSNTVVVCQNSFYMAYKDLNKVRHTHTADAKIKIIREKLENAMLSDSLLMDNYKRMTEAPIEKSIVKTILSEIFSENFDNGLTKDISSKKRNQMKTFNTVIEKECASHGASLWGLFNAVTYYTNHIKPKNKNEKTEYIMTGAGAKLNFKTYENIINYMDSKQKTSILI